MIALKKNNTPRLTTHRVVLSNLNNSKVTDEKKKKRKSGDVRNKSSKFKTTQVFAQKWTFTRPQSFFYTRRRGVEWRKKTGKRQEKLCYEVRKSEARGTFAIKRCLRKVGVGDGDFFCRFSREREKEILLRCATGAGFILNHFIVQRFRCMQRLE